MRRFLLLLLLIAVAVTCFAQKKKKAPELSSYVLQAQYIYVTGWDGDLNDPSLLPQERTAIERVIAALDEWHRYRVINTPTQADLMLVVKVGNLSRIMNRPGIGGVDTPIQIGTPPPPSSRRGGAGLPGAGTELGDTRDMLLLSIHPGERPDETPPVWRRSANRGFEGRVSLVEELKKSVEESEKAIADSKKP